MKRRCLRRKRDALIIEGEADAKRTRILAEAFGADPEFFDFYRSLRAYESFNKGGKFNFGDPTRSRILDLLAVCCATRGQVIAKLLFGLAAVMIAEGLVYLLAPHAIEELLKALKSLSISARRQLGAMLLVGGCILAVLAA